MMVIKQLDSKNITSFCVSDQGGEAGRGQEKDGIGGSELAKV